MLLNKNWKMIYKGKEYLCKRFPVSMYQTLIMNGAADDPYYGENQYEAKELSREDCEFYCDFVPEGELFQSERITMSFYGLDTLAQVYLNGDLLFNADNMFFTYRHDVTQNLLKGKNRLSVKFSSPLVYAENAYKDRPLFGVEGTVPGYQHIRKAHYNFGWDWGPQLPDMGIWRDVELTGSSVCHIDSVYYKQNFSEDYKKLTLTVIPQVNLWDIKPLELLIEIKLSDGRSLISRKSLSKSEKTEFTIENPPLWNVRGLGEQPLQTVILTVLEGENTLCEHSEKIGFRHLTVKNEPENNKFCFVCNGIEVFAMGADIIPNDQILPFATDKRTDSMLEQCVFMGFNCVRVWGGGVYPDDHFLEKCDELGLILWQDFMFACAAYKLNTAFTESIQKEVRDNIVRIRNHACLGLWCGNNEIESMWEGWGVPDDPEAKADYVKLFEEIIPAQLKKYDSERFYWPSSPSSGGNQFKGSRCFKGSSDCDKGDQHFWAVWHSFAPLEKFRQYDFPFCSEYGFESIPAMKTIATFASRKDLNLTSPVMEAHQKCGLGNEKLLFYIAQMCRCPKNFEETIYATQLVQAESIRLNAEHLRRKRGRCMGSLFWQLNDSNPVISWSAVDYFGRPKALFYASRRFYAPLLISCLEEKIEDIQLHITNDTMDIKEGSVLWQLRKNDGTTVKKGEYGFKADPLSAQKVLSLDFSKELKREKDKRSCFLEYSAVIEGEEVSRGCTIFVRPKSFTFLPPGLSLAIEETPSKFILNIKSKNFAKGVLLDLRDGDCIFSDNFFDICGRHTVTVDKSSLTMPFTAQMLKSKLTVMSCYDLEARV